MKEDWLARAKDIQCKQHSSTPNKVQPSLNIQSRHHFKSISLDIANLILISELNTIIWITWKILISEQKLNFYPQQDLIIIA